MIFSFTGAQSTGKTTLLRQLRLKNGTWPIEFVPEVTRLIKRVYNVPINEDGGDLTQLLIMTEHVRNIYKYTKDIYQKIDIHMIFDRCALDGIVYSEWLFNSGKISRECYDACKLIYKDLQDKYDIIFYTSPDDVKLVDDGERSVDKEFRDNILELFDLYMHSYKGKIIVLKGSVEERLETIKLTLAKHNIDIKI